MNDDEFERKQKTFSITENFEPRYINLSRFFDIFCSAYPRKAVKLCLSYTY